jgi:hypothetical protein
MASPRSSEPRGDGREDAYQGLIGQATSGSRIAGDGGDPEDPPPAATRKPLAKSLFTARYVIPGVLVLFGVVYMMVDRRNGAEAFSLFAGAGLSILLLNVLYRMGVEGDRDRDVEEAARDYFTEHGVWPEEPEKRRRRPGGRSR